jgi:pantothenate kinase-related protein Tda10
MSSRPAVAANDTAQDLEQVLTEDEKGYFDVNQRTSRELVIAFVGPVGSGATTACEAMKDKLVQIYGYDAIYIKLRVRTH